MTKYLTGLIFLTFLSVPTHAQDEQPAEEVVQAAPVAGDEQADADPVIGGEEIVGDEDLDEQIYEEDDDDFVPTEEIPADEPIPFPSNI